MLATQSALLPHLPAAGAARGRARCVARAQGAVDASAPEVSMAFAVDMACQACVAPVRRSAESVPGAFLPGIFLLEPSLMLRGAGVSFFEADLEAQTVTVNGSASVEELLAALGKGGRDVRLIGQGSVAGARWPPTYPPVSTADHAAGFDESLAAELGTDMRTLRQSLAAVAEFKGESWGHGALVGVVRFVQVRNTMPAPATSDSVQVSRSLLRAELSLEGLSPGRHTLAVHEYGACCRCSLRPGSPVAPQAT